MRRIGLVWIFADNPQYGGIKVCKGSLPQIYGARVTKVEIGLEEVV
jgi:hypothetical protein